MRDVEAKSGKKMKFHGKGRGSLQNKSFILHCNRFGPNTYLTLDCTGSGRGKLVLRSSYRFHGHKVGREGLVYRKVAGTSREWLDEVRACALDASRNFPAHGENVMCLQSWVILAKYTCLRSIERRRDSESMG